VEIPENKIALMGKPSVKIETGLIKRFYRIGLPFFARAQVPEPLNNSICKGYDRGQVF
jgi:hypothetical protein